MYDDPPPSDINELLRYLIYCFIWLCVWTFLLLIPPGPAIKFSNYRLNFVLGMIAPLAAMLYKFNIIRDVAVTPIMVSYFIVDTLHNIINDFIWKTPCDRKSTDRFLEYFHHIMCLSICLYSDFFARDVCLDLNENPFIDMMLAEISTPFLMLYRIYKITSTQGLLAVFCFVPLFVSVRLLYHGFWSVPNIFMKCECWPVKVTGVLYISMNLFFTLQIVQRLVLRKPSPPPRISSISSDMDGFNSNYSLGDLLKEEEVKEKQQKQKQQQQSQQDVNLRRSSSKSKKGEKSL